MRVILFFLLSFISLQALSIKINSGKFEQKPYSILHLEHEKEFNCIANKTMRDKVYEYVCDVDNVALNRFATSQNNFFILSSNVDNGKFSIKIEGKQDMIMYPIEYDLKNKQTIEWHKDTKSKHWIVLGFSGKIPVITDKKEQKGLSFPLDSTGSAKPYIGALDLDKNPLYFETSDDIKTFLDVKQIYEDEKFEDVVVLVDDYLEKNKNSLFESDFMLYKIKALGDIGGEEQAEKNMALTDKWIKSFPSNENLAEVMVYAGLAHARAKQEEQAKAYFNKVIQQHPKSRFASLAKIYLGDIYYNDLTLTNGQMMADKMYRDALYNTDDIEIASMASMRIGDVSTDADDLKRADEYYRKVLNANKEHMLKDPKKAYALIKKLRLKKAYLLAADIGASLLDKISKNHEIYESLLNDVATWYNMGRNISKAIDYYQLYLKLYPGSDFSNNVKRELDLLIFEENGKSAEEKLKKYDYLIEQYKSQDIAMKAVYNKAKLLYDLKRYDEALALEEELYRIPAKDAPDVKELIGDITKALAIASLDNNCYQSVQLIKRYNVRLEDTYDKKLYKCYYQTFEYQSAIDICNKYIQSKDLATKLDWLYNIEKALFKKGEQSEVLKISKDILELSNLLKTTMYNDIYYDLFEVYAQTNDISRLSEFVSKIETHYPDRLENINVYKKMVVLGQNSRDNFIIIDNARKIIQLQKKHGISQETPWIETIAIDTYLALDKLEQALEIAKEASVNPKIKDADRAKILYSQAKIYQKMGNMSKQKQTLEECSSIGSNSQWVVMCKEALKWTQ